MIVEFKQLFMLNGNKTIKEFNQFLTARPQDTIHRIINLRKMMTATNAIVALRITS